MLWRKPLNSQELWKFVFICVWYNRKKELIFLLPSLYIYIQENLLTSWYSMVCLSNSFLLNIIMKKLSCWFSLMHMYDKKINISFFQSCTWSQHIICIIIDVWTPLSTIFHRGCQLVGRKSPIYSNASGCQTSS